MPTYADFQKFYDTTLIETAVQAFFIAVVGANFVAPLDETNPARGTWTPAAGQTAFYTNKDVVVNQAARPRVKSRLHSIQHVRGAYALDANGNFQEKAWTASLDLGIVTAPNYTTHSTLRSLVRAIIPTVLGQIAPDGSLFATTGINALLNYHQVSEFWTRNTSTDVQPGDSAYLSAIPIQLAFGVLPSAWPAGMQTV